MDSTDIIDLSVSKKINNYVLSLNIDNLLNSFDLRSAEKSFQLLTQVSGRAGSCLLYTSDAADE